MTFERPELLALAPLAALLFAFAIGAHWRRARGLARAYELAALRRLLPATVDRFPTRRFLCLVGAGVLLGLAAAGPVWLELDPPDPPQPLDVALAVDLSPSMSIDDVRSSRVERARETVDRLTEELPSVRFSLLVFARWPYVLVPPTDDPDVIRYFTASLHPEAVQEVDRGTTLSATLGMARQTLDSRLRENARRVILVLSDGDIHDDEEALRRAGSEASDAGYEVWMAGVGTEAGGPVRMGGETVRDVGGRAVLVGQNTDRLRAIARAGGGRYEDVTEASGLESLVQALRDVSGDTDGDPAEPFDTTALLALLAIPLLLWEGAVDGRRSRRARREADTVLPAEATT